MTTPTEIHQACHRVLAKSEYLPAADGRTFCNFAMHDILSALGLPEFCIDADTKRPMLANFLCEKMEQNCKKLSFLEASELSRSGAVVVAGMKMPFHGHVAVVYPFPGLYTSGKWKRGDVPCVANIGKDNGVMPLNWAFGGYPQLYLVKSNDGQD